MPNDKVREATRNASQLYLYDESAYRKHLSWIWVPPERRSFRQKLHMFWVRLKGGFHA